MPAAVAILQAGNVIIFVVVNRSISRRNWLAALPLAFAPPRKPQQLPNTGEFFHFLDPTTENPVVRLTNPSTSSFLPAPVNPFVSLKDRSLFFSSNRTGVLSPFELNLRTGAVTQLARTSRLDPRSLSLDERRRSVYLLDGGALQEIALRAGKTRTIAAGVTAFSPSPSGFFIIRQERLEHVAANESAVLAENVSPWCLARPGGKGCAFGRDSTSQCELWYSPVDSAPSKPVRLCSGNISNPIWSPAGETLLFLRHVPGNNGFTLSEIHEVIPETGEERLVARTSQFASFSPNANGSVFVGASASHAQPDVILLIRSVHRELTLCEHRASNPAGVNPVFSPDSRRVYFESDREGKSALYSVNVELLVEPTSRAM